MHSPDLPGLPAPSAEAVALFGDRLELVERFGHLLAGDAVVRGLIGPRETPRLWDRHLVNCAVLGELLPAGAAIVDVGSGAGLPGLVLACLRPDLGIDLVDAQARRTAFLTEAVTALDLGDRVHVHTGRVEDRSMRRSLGGSRWVTARAVAPLDRLARWCLPLLAPGGRLLAVKGSAAADEVAQHRRALEVLGASSVALVECGLGRVVEPARVVVVAR